MELCPKCKRMTAEKNHNTGKVICYNKFCDQQAGEGNLEGRNSSDQNSQHRVDDRRKPLSLK